MPVHALLFRYAQRVAAEAAAQATSTKSLDQARKNRCSRYSRYFNPEELCEAWCRIRRTAALGVDVHCTAPLPAGPAVHSEFQAIRRSNHHCPQAVAAAAQRTVLASSAGCRGPPFNPRSNLGLINQTT